MTEELAGTTAEDLAALATRDPETAARLLGERGPFDAASVLGRLAPKERLELVRAMEPELAGHAVWELEREDRVELLEELDDEMVVLLVSVLPDDGAADLVGDLDDDRRVRALGALPAGRPAAVERLLAHAAETAGALMSTDFVSVPTDATVEGVVDTLRAHRETGFVYYVYLVGARGEPVGVTSLRELIVAEPHTRVETIAHRDLVSVAPDADQEEVARLADRYDLLAVPVVGHDGVMLGVVTADDVLEVLSDEAEEDVERFAGAPEPESDRPGMWSAARARLPWMAATLIVELPLAYVFLRPLPAVAAGTLIAFVPLLLFAGSSTAIAAAGVMLRRLVRHERAPARLLARELQGGLLLGLIGASVVAASLFMGGQPARIVGVVGWAVGLTIIASSSIGAFAPLVLQALRQDPVLASGPALGLLADACALAIYLLAARLEFG